MGRAGAPNAEAKKNGGEEKADTKPAKPGDGKKTDGKDAGGKIGPTDTDS